MRGNIFLLITIRPMQPPSAFQWQWLQTHSLLCAAAYVTSAPTLMLFPLILFLFVIVYASLLSTLCLGWREGWRYKGRGRGCIELREEGNDLSNDPKQKVQLVMWPTKSGPSPIHLNSSRKITAFWGFFFSLFLLAGLTRWVHPPPPVVAARAR